MAFFNHGGFKDHRARWQWHHVPVSVTRSFRLASGLSLAATGKNWCLLGIHMPNCTPFCVWLGTISRSPLRDALQMDVLMGQVIGGHEAQPHSWKWQVTLVSYTCKKPYILQKKSEKTTSSTARSHTHLFCRTAWLGCKICCRLIPVSIQIACADSPGCCSHTCGGTRISPHWVMAPARCLSMWVG